MKYSIELKKRAIKDLKNIPKSDILRIVEKLKHLENNLSGNVKQLTNFTPEYRLRVGKWRVLFEIEKTTVVVYRIKHRRDAYSK
ncbi:type II toxin-antitoxin system RelE family toxin [Desulfonema magnum]|uniref:Toxin-antitoxin system, toxin component, RelE/ParE-like n=1 Tax=Desulfonema magnum TaxID=45655 RepID=A0A975BL96_9BACT|nr:type II toxin-antitoxin system RelE/ParE family toxin [Desulfonema magnum]QTA87471.1 Toxin-antitoxin system, toxin component, RelE/ParE-like [Desulfonema magnum]